MSEGADQIGRAPAVRPFLVTAGRVAGAGDTVTGSGPPMPVETQVVATVSGLAALDGSAGTAGDAGAAGPAGSAGPVGLAFERHDIVAAARRPQSLAEIAARLRLHLNVVRVLAEDLRAGGHLSVYMPSADTAQDVSVLRRVIDGLRTIPNSRGNTP